MTCHRHEVGTRYFESNASAADRMGGGMTALNEAANRQPRYPVAPVVTDACRTGGFASPPCDGFALEV